MRPRMAIVLVLCAVAAAQEVTPVQLPAGATVHDVIYADIDGDGARDLVVSARDGDRVLRIHLRRKGRVAFAGEPDYTLASLWTDVVAYAVADVHADPGAEVILFTAKAVWVWRPRAGERERVQKIVSCAFLWQLADWGGAVAWQPAVRDVDGNGLVDLVIPEPNGYRIVRQQRRGVFTEAQVIVVPAGPAQKDSVVSLQLRSRRLRDEATLRFTVGGDESDQAERRRGPLVAIHDSVPAPQFVDWDADGDRDLVVRTERWLFVWLQNPSGRFTNAPVVSLEMPVRQNRERQLEVSYSAHVKDLDGDRRVDCVIFSGDQRANDVRTQVQFFLQGAKKHLFADGLPDQLLVLAGFAGDPRLDDVDGDGYADLVVAAVRPDLMDALRGSSARIDAELYVFRNRRGVFSRRPDLTFRMQLEATGLKVGRKRTALARFFADVNGDGVKDLLLRDERQRVRVFLTRRSRQGLTIHPKPLWELKVEEHARLYVRGRDLVVLERNQVLVVRWP